MQVLRVFPAPLPCTPSLHPFIYSPYLAPTIVFPDRTSRSFSTIFPNFAGTYQPEQCALPPDSKLFSRQPQEACLDAYLSCSKLRIRRVAFDQNQKAVK
jgi:hypothetical protein